MYEFYSKGSSALAEDDIRAIQFVYGVPPNKKFRSTSKITPQDVEDEIPVWAQSTILPNKCNTSYDAIAEIDGEIIAFKGKFMFQSTAARGG